MNANPITFPSVSAMIGFVDFIKVKVISFRNLDDALMTYVNYPN